MNPNINSIFALMIEFVFPGFLWALLLLSIPIIIHLFHFRRFKKVYFTNLSFLKEVKEETSSRNKLKNLLVLISRLLAMAFLVFAFAQPFIPSGNNLQSGIRGVSVYIDNSFSMEALSNDVSLLNRAKQKAKEVINAYGEMETFQVLSNNFSASQQRLLTKEEALLAVDEIETRPEVHALSSVISRQRQSLENGRFDLYSLYLISDFQKSITDEIQPIDSAEQITVIPLQAIQELNVSVDSSWFVSKVPIINQNNQLAIRLTNHSNDDREGVRLSINYNEQVKPLGLKEIPAQSSIIDTISLTFDDPGWNTATIKIEDYPIQFDDEYHIAFDVKEKIAVLSIFEDERNEYLTALMQGIPSIESVFVTVNRVSYAELSNYELIILQDLTSISSGLTAALEEYVSNGGNIIIFPSQNLDLNNYQNFQARLRLNQFSEKKEGQMEVGEINMDSYVFRDVFQQNRRNFQLPKANVYFSSDRLPSNSEELILQFRNGQTYLGKYDFNSGSIYVCHSPLNDRFNDLVLNAEIFVPLVFKIAVSTGSSKAIAYTIGKNRVLEAPGIQNNNDLVYKLRSTDELIPAQVNAGNKVLIQLKDELKNAGVYDLVLGNDVIEKYAFNYNNLESELEFYNNGDLSTLFTESVQIMEQNTDSNFTQFIEESEQGKSLWKWCIIFTLIFLGMEQLLLRFFKS